MNGYNRDLQFDIILPNLKVTSFKQVLRNLANEAALHFDVNADLLFDALNEKELCESSGTGEGIAIPHIQASGIPKSFTMLATLNTPVDCDAVDNEPTDVIALLVSPENDGPLHLRRLSRISRLLKNEELHQKLQEAKDEQAIRALLIDPEGWLMAA